MYREKKLPASITCDQVFDALTSSPESVRPAQQLAVERHLSACCECRELAGSIGPAVDLFHDSMASADAESPHVSPARLEAAASAARGARLDSWRLAATFAAGALLAVMFLGVSGNGLRPSFGNRGAGTPANIQSTRHQPTESGRAWLATVGLQAVCFPAAESPAETAGAHRPSLSQSETYACCLSCHSKANASRPPLEAQAMLDRACHVCHNY